MNFTFSRPSESDSAPYFAALVSGSWTNTPRLIASARGVSDNPPATKRPAAYAATRTVMPSEDEVLAAEKALARLLGGTGHSWRRAATEVVAATALVRAPIHRQ